MKKKQVTPPLLALSLTVLAPSIASAHELWVNAPPVASGQPLAIEMGYGENFPHGEPIPTQRQALFDNLQVIGGSGPATEYPVNSEKYQFSKTDAAAGSWLVIATYKPSRWSVKQDGEKYQWRQADKKNWPGSYCMENTMSAKTVSYVGSPGNNSAITRTTGVRLEFVPTVDPSTLKTGDTLQIKVLANGEPLKNHQVGIAYIDLTKADSTKEVYGHHHHYHAADSSLRHPVLAHTYAYENATLKDNTDENGVLHLPVLNKGQWVLMTAHDAPYQDKAACDIYLDSATFGFYINQ